MPTKEASFPGEGTLVCPPRKHPSLAKVPSYALLRDFLWSRTTLPMLLIDLSNVSP
jgi:hypothetical protein